VTVYRGPELLGPDHVIDEFDCGAEALNDWLTRRARSNQGRGASRTWVVTDADQVVGYYASSTAVVLRSEATKRAARNQPDPVPALLLGRLAVDRKHQGRGLAAALLKHFLLKSLEVAEVTGVRVLLVHAKDEQAAAFYRHFEFEPSPVDDLTLMLLVQDLTG
jgi:predicted N-acetyltransferase YhbS